MENLPAEQMRGTAFDPGDINHRGPNSLRNTCTAVWFNSGIPLAEMQRRCRFKDTSAMSRLWLQLIEPFAL